MKAAAALVLALAAGLPVLAGCGGTVIETANLDAQVKSDIEKKLPQREDLQKTLKVAPDEKVRSVDCPSEVDANPGTTFTCQVTFEKGAEAKEEFEIVNKDADVHSISDLEPAGTTK